MAAGRQRVIGALDAVGADYELIDIDPEHADTVAFCERYGYPVENSANTIIVASKREPKKLVACVVLATTRLDVNRKVRSLMDVGRVSFATFEEMAEVTGMQVGGVTPFGLPDDMPLFVDRRVMDRPWVIIGGGDRSAKIKLAPRALGELPMSVIIDELAKPL